MTIIKPSLIVETKCFCFLSKTYIGGTPKVGMAARVLRR
jgi:hypothetical protein